LRGGGGYVPVANRGMITASIMLANIMQGVDNTIANVALPHIQGSLSASQDQVAWVLTSYIVTAAIMMPLTGWLAGRFGIKYVFLISVLGFTFASALCGAATSLSQLVAFRVMQGVCGAALVPLSQSVLFQINPPERHGQAMAVWGIGVMLGPITGPALGGWLTDEYSWRWVFYINLPFGILATAGLIFFMPRTDPREGMRFDWIGFTVLSLGIGGLQLMLDRGQDQDWFSSGEIIVELVLGGLGVYLFVVHMLTARRPFIPPALFKDRNFAAGVAMMFAAGTILVSSSSLMAPWLQNLANYPVDAAGLIMAPRGIGTMIAMVLAGRIAARTDARLLMGFGILCVVWSIWEMTTWTPDISETRLIFTICVQGFGLGFLFIPLQMLAFATLPVMLRTDGASLFSLARNIGAAIGVSITSSELARNTQALHAEIGASVTPFNRALQDGGAVHQYLDPTTRHGAAMLDHIINQQAQIIAYVDDYKLMIFTTLPALLLLFLMRRPQQAPRAADSHAAME
jgi:MFS transporter, DHA2 family, multidrug resistance protein